MAMSRFLWLRGGPGTGKTVLSASIINYLETNSIYPTAYFFCTHADIRKRQTSSIVQSLIHQLATRCEAAFEASYKFQSKATRAGRPVELVSWELFAKVLEAGGTCDLVIDGLDECLDNDLTGRVFAKTSRRNFLGTLLSITKSTSTRILLCSRNEIGIPPPSVALPSVMIWGPVPT
jgi:hypothetical protein